MINMPTADYIMWSCIIASVSGFGLLWCLLCITRDAFGGDHD